MLVAITIRRSSVNVSEQPQGYERFFGLAEPPFTLTSNPRFLFESASYQAALQEIAYALPRREPIIVVTGAIGTGKTTLCRIIAERRGPRTVVATISTPPDNVDDLLRQILDGFGLLTDNTSEAVQASHYGLIRTLQQFLTSLVSLNAQAIILFDEAQQLRPDMLEQIRLLSNFDTDNRKLLQIIFVGQPELDDLLAREDLQQMNQRISRRHRLGPLQPAEVSAYVEKRLTVARAAQSNGERPQFTASAMRAIATLSGGIPRVINTLCDRSLENAWTDQTHTIDTATVVRAARALNMDVPLPVRVRVKRSYVQIGAAAVLVLGAVLLWTVRDSAFSRFARRPAAQPDAVQKTAPAVPTPPEPVAAASAPPATTTPAGPDRFLIVVSSFRTQERAAQVASDIVGLGLPAFVRNASDWQQVVVGPYVSREAAVAAQRRLVDVQFDNTTISQAGTLVAAPPPTPVVRPPPAAAIRPPGAPAKSVSDDIKDLPLDEVLRRASELARQPNVRALQQIREQVVKRQEAASGAAELASYKSAIDQLDRDLDEARRRQLEEDARRLGAKP
jgi:general secretion pathway protein A